MLFKELAENKVDIANTIERFLGNKKIYQQFLNKFLADNNYELFLEDIEKKDYENAQKHIHTLKGVAANLGLTPIFDSASQINNKLRNNELTDLVELSEQLIYNYKNICSIIKKYQKL